MLDIKLPAQHNPVPLLPGPDGIYPDAQDYRPRISPITRLLKAAHATPYMQTVLFDAVSAHALYREVFAKSLRPKTVFALLKAILPGSNSTDKS